LKQEEEIEAIVEKVKLPPGVVIRKWTEADFAEIYELSAAEGWNSPRVSKAQNLEAWQNSWPALVAISEGRVIGHLRALSDGALTTYIADILVAPQWRGKGLGKVLLEVCHQLAPRTHFVLMSVEKSTGFYEADGFEKSIGYSKDFLPRIDS
jgi:GNAT superfamily N-acetyltransferase